MMHDPVVALCTDPDEYDFHHSTLVEDIEFYARVIERRRPDTVLELGCGSGRLLVPLVERFAHAERIDFWGVDISEAMLHKLRSKVDVTAPYAPRLVQADVREFSIPMACDLILASFHLPNLMMNHANLRAMLRRMHHHLLGRALLNFHVPEYDIYLKGPNERHHHVDGTTRQGNYWCGWETSTYDHRSQILTVTSHYCCERERVERSEVLTYRAWFPQEIELLLGMEHLEVVDFYTSFDGSSEFKEMVYEVRCE